jgi:hypothetical protein
LIVVASAVERHDLAQSALLAEFPASDSPLTQGHVPQRWLVERDDDANDGSDGE